MLIFVDVFIDMKKRSKVRKYKARKGPRNRHQLKGAMKYMRSSKRK